MKCPKYWTTEEIRKIVEHLGGDPSVIRDNWFWKELAENYPHLKKPFEEFLENANTGNPTEAACCMVRYSGSSREWAEGVIENAKTGDPSFIAYYQVRNCGSSIDWEEKIKNKFQRRIK